MRELGTIDEAGFRSDLYAESQNDYPPLQLVKLPFNWYVPEADRGTAPVVRGSSLANIQLSTSTVVAWTAGTVAGDIALVMFGGGFAGEAVPTPSGWTRGGTQANANWDGVALWKVLNSADVAAGSMTFSLGGNLNAQVGLVIVDGATTSGVLEADSVGGTPTTGVTLFVDTSNSATATSLGIYFQSGAAAVGTFVPSINRGTLLQSTSVSTWAGQIKSENFSTDGIQSIGFETPGTAPANGVYDLVVVFLAVPQSAFPPPPNNPISLSGPNNFFSLVNEAIDEQGQYWESLFQNAQAAAGFIRLNGQGNVWFPVSLMGPLVPGFATSNPNYTGTPIAGTGFSAIEAPFGQLEWIPGVPTFYSGSTPPTEPPGYLLAYVSVSVGTGSGIGNGNASTYAIPSSAGPVERLKKACLLL